MRNYLFLFLTLLPCVLSAQSSLLDSLGIDTTRQTAAAVQYWFDAGTTRSTLPAISGTQRVDVSMLSYGLHALHMQVIHSDGSAGMSRSALFIKNMQNDSTIAAASLQYWFDEDRASARTTTADIHQLDVSSLSYGLHTLHMQIMHADGSMGVIRSVFFIKTINDVAAQNSTIRYWFDTDDEASAIIATGVHQLDVSHLSHGTHALHMQIIHADGSVGTIRTEIFSTADSDVTCLTIGTGTGSSYNVPFNNNYKNAWTQSIYTADEIGYSGEIAAIQFHCAAVNSTAYSDDNLTIYMAHTSKSVAGSTTDWIPEAELVEVYSASPFAHPTDTGWFKIDLHNYFQYNGSGNLAVIIARQSSSYAGGQKYTYTSGTSGVTLYRRSDSDASYGTHPGSTTGTKTTERANAIFCFAEDNDLCPEPVTISDSATICQGETFVWNSKTLTKAGTYQTLLTNGGCDTILTLSLGVLEATASTDSVRICEGDTYTWQGQTFTQAGEYTDTLQAITGCDSICTLVLTVNPSYSMTEEAAICEGETYAWHNRVLSEAGQYTDSLQSLAGCDSIIVLTLQVYPNYRMEDTASVCQDEAYIWRGRKLTEAGIYTDTLRTIYGCDSIFTLTLEVLPAYFAEDNAAICDNETYRWQGRTLQASGTYTDSLLTKDGCDSILVLNLQVYPTFHFKEIVAIREDKLPYQWHGQTINASGTYTDSLLTLNGCDSIHTLQLTVTPLPIYSVTVEADHGHVEGTGTYPEGTVIPLHAVPDEGFEFQLWSNGETANPYQFRVMQDTTFRAHFFMPEVEQEVTVDSISTNSVTITWDSVAGAVLYELRIYKNGQLVVTYQIDPDNNIIGELFHGPDRLIARRDSTGGSSETLQVDISGLDPGADYTYSLDSFADDRSYVGAQSGTFTTEEEPIDGLDTLFDKRHPAEPRKILRDGLLFIELPDGRLYTPIGDELQ